MTLEQKHPLAPEDRKIIDMIKAEGKTDYNIAEVARLKIRYQGFPGARDIQRDLDFILQQWGMTEEELFATARKLHQPQSIYCNKINAEQDREDWI
ncbi:MAG: DUF3288 family protein [Geminocystis sp.]|nr:DUF3288 family protein [Geminocystis sp.]HIK38474.1 DUF3288 family protein [Geminocystis sp. M7585_C2015_104]MCS7146851.1 DUF3288 family protein [Geminocystis sp.]MCX8078871.1 DUF3288 family protein [Geminocystis sp.]MDW8115676.1 DUF3288 family protein [Geminocystis sp.]